ncbi:hypothetical protein TRVA0_013S01354 [Trichomonascus vanleenenianus]|uniref:uncharacterized protein n=1 Tax=Trichomonascus vanleenenianus TaxID=2268995 RepID=UPI003ECB4FC2
MPEESAFGVDRPYLTAYKHYMCHVKNCLYTTPSRKEYKGHMVTGRHLRQNPKDLRDLGLEEPQKMDIAAIVEKLNLHYDEDAVLVPQGLERTAVRVDKHYRFAVCFGRQIILVRSQIIDHCTFCAYCNDFDHFEAQRSILKLKQSGALTDSVDLDSEYYAFKRVDPATESLPPPINGSKKAVKDLCLECLRLDIGWLSINTDLRTRKSHFAKHHAGFDKALYEKKLFRCTCSEFFITSNGNSRVHFPSNRPVEEDKKRRINSSGGSTGRKRSFDAAVVDERTVKRPAQNNAIVLGSSLEEEEEEEDNNEHPSGGSAPLEPAYIEYVEILDDDDYPEPESNDKTVNEIPTTTATTTNTNDRPANDLKTILNSNGAQNRRDEDNDIFATPPPSDAYLPRSEIVPRHDKKEQSISASTTPDLSEPESGEDLTPDTPVEVHESVPVTYAFSLRSFSRPQPPSPKFVQAYESDNDLSSFELSDDELATLKAEVDPETAARFRLGRKDTELLESVVQDLTNAKAEDQLMHKIMSIALSYIRSCYMDVRDSSRRDLLTLAGLPPLDASSRELHFLHFVKAVAVIFRSYLSGTDASLIKFIPSQAKAIEEFLESAQRCSVHPRCEAKPRDDAYVNYSYELQKEMVDYGSSDLEAENDNDEDDDDDTSNSNVSYMTKDAKLRLRLADMFCPDMNFAHGSDPEREESLKRLHMVLVRILTECPLGYNWTLAMSVLAIMLNRRKKAGFKQRDQTTVDAQEAAQQIERAIYIYKLIAVRTVLDTSDSDWSNVGQNPWYAMACKGSDSPFFAQMYALRDEFISIDGGLYYGGFGHTDHVSVNGCVFSKELITKFNSSLMDVLASFTKGIAAEQRLKIPSGGHRPIIDDPSNTQRGYCFLSENANAEVLKLSRAHYTYSKTTLLSDVDEFDLATVFLKCDALLRHLAALIFNNLPFPVSAAEIVNWTFRNHSCKRNIFIRKDMICIERVTDCISGGTPKAIMLSWVTSELLVQYLCLARPLQVYIAERLRRTDLVPLLRHYLFVSYNGKWAPSDFERTYSEISLQHMGRCVTPLAWKSALGLYQRRHDVVAKVQRAIDVSSLSAGGPSFDRSWHSSTLDNLTPLFLDVVDGNGYLFSDIITSVRQRIS